MKRIWMKFCSLAGILWISNLAWGAPIVDRVVAVVNKEPITLWNLERSKLFTELQRELSGYSEMEAVSSDPQILLESLIEEILLNQQAQTEKIEIRSEEIEQAMNQLLEQKEWKREDLQKLLDSKGFSEEEYRHSVEKQIARYRLVSSHVRAEVQVDETDLQEYYRIHKKEFSKGEKWHLQQILLKDEKEGWPQAQSIHREISQGKDFAELAQQYSIGPGREAGGDLGWVRGEDLLPELREKVEGLRPGEISKPFRTSAGIHIVRLIQRVPDEPIPFPEVKRKIQEQLFQEKSQQAMERYIDSLKATATIERR
ncbi:MAG: peptidyl-prolyl cis-trans isomerase [Deltaproteobacteria bacterium]|nr:peptidyl-prolyl cis-trans isomerase [Deltaproteobacteria bacterium]